MVKLNLPLRPWVPQWLGIVTMFVVMFPIIMLNGTYTGSMLEVSSTRDTQRRHHNGVLCGSGRYGGSLSHHS